ncbi:MAG: DUF5110 domain-containing protein [Muribaculaceae bacterium]|nr:DUF5110 domain-containing protein [Muribaculaceae bacterium]
MNVVRSLRLDFVLLVSLACAGIAAAAEASISRNTSAGRTVTVTAVSPYIVRVDNYGAGETAAGVQSVLDLGADASGCAVSRDGVLRTTGGIKAWFSPEGLLNIENSGVRGSLIVDPGTRRLKDGRTELQLFTSSIGSMYGAGERGHSLNLRGDTLVMYNRQNYGYTGSDPRISQMNITMPLVLSNDGYALVFDDYAAAELILKRTVSYITESRKPVSYYYVSGTDAAQLTEHMTELTGRQPLPPLWALGYITSKYGYRTQQETLGVVDTLKQAGYPLDGIVLDLYWYGKEQDMGRLAWDPDQWPEPEAMLGKLKDQGVNLVAISQPYILRNGRGLDNYDRLAAQGLMVKDSVTGDPREVKIWVGEGGMFDVSNPLTRRWLTDRYKQLTDMGVAGWWGDLGEPEVHPLGSVHDNGLSTREYHNKYGNDWSEIISSLFAEQYPDRRLMTLMRGGTTGLQRHSVFPWSTDVSRSWGGLEPQVRIMLNSGLSGLGYMSSDLGGFAVDEGKEYQPDLYVRWVETGLFSPVFRTHGTKFAEPYNYPGQEEILKTLVRERYRWLPYNYTLAYENAVFGYPLVRPLDFDTNAHGAYDRISDQYMWGHEVMVAPVMTAAESRNITFPAGSDWVDYNHPRTVYKGGSRATAYPAPLDVIPLFVRQGSFIPMADYAMENTGDYRADAFTVSFYPKPDGSSQNTMYDDDRLSPRSIDDGQYRLVTFDGSSADDEVLISVRAEGAYAGAPGVINFNFVVYGQTSAPRKVLIGRKSVPFKYDDATGAVLFPASFDTSRLLKIKIQK